MITDLITTKAYKWGLVAVMKGQMHICLQRVFQGIENLALMNKFERALGIVAFIEPRWSHHIKTCGMHMSGSEILFTANLFSEIRPSKRL